MSPNERAALEEELNNLKKILDFYIEFRKNISSLDDRQIDAHIDDMLDRVSEILKILGYEE